MCEPTTLAAIGSWFGGTAATGAAAGTAATAATTTAAAGMTTAQMISLGLSAAGTGLTAVGAYNQSQAAKAAAEANAKTAEIQAQDAQRRGEQDVQELQRRAAAYKSSQRTAMAAKGLDLGYGTAADLQDQVDFFSQADAATARTNARKEAWAARSQGANFQREAAASRPWLAGGSTLLAGAGQVADRWYSYRRT